MYSMHAISLNTMPLYRFTNRPFWVIIQDNYCILGYIILYVHQGRMQDFSRGAHSKILGIMAIRTCREAACREQQSCKPLLGGFGGMLPQRKFF